MASYRLLDTAKSMLNSEYLPEAPVYFMVLPTMQDAVDPEETCQGPHITQYQISFETGSTVITDNVSTSGCTDGRCSHTFEPPSNPPSSYDSVSVAAENVVGVGAARTCTTQTISKLTLLDSNIVARKSTV